MTPYPLDYQRTLQVTIDLRLDAARRDGRMGEEARLRNAIDRLRSGKIGGCESCGGTIPYLEIAADPAASRCARCIEEQIHACSSTS